MRAVYADTTYWVALIHRRDELHDLARDVSRGLGQCKIYTSESVFVELLNFFAEKGLQARKLAVNMVEHIRRDPNTVVINQSSLAFDTALKLYSNRPDKGYSLTDCESMMIMSEHDIKDILTHDSHFTQEGFNNLL